MSQLFDLNNFLLVACIGLILALAFIVLKNAPKENLNRVFFLISVSASIWIFTNLMANLALSKGEDRYFLWTQASLFGPSFLPLLLPFFAYLFPGKKLKINKAYFISFGLSSIICLILLPTKFNIISVRIINPTKYLSTFSSGPLYTFFGISLFLSLILTISIFVKKYRLTEDTSRLQSRYAIIGISLSVIASLIMSVFLPVIGFTQFINFSPVASLFFVIFSAYAIFKYQFMNMKSIIAEIMVYLIMVIIFSELLFSTNTAEIIIRIFLLGIMFYTGNILVKSTEKEIKQKEELQLLAKELEEANSHLKEMDQMKDDFLAMASHELNTPLAAISGYLSMMLEEGMGGELQPQTREYLERIFTSSERLTEIVRDLLDVSRIESGRIHMIYAEVQIEDIIKQAVMEVAPKLKEKRHEICFELPAHSLPITWLDKTRITEIVINFLGNAIKYTDDEGHLEIGAKFDKDIIVWVKDSGRGIPPERADRIFAKFSQVNVLTDEVKGTGLGMYISKKFIEMHKGKIWFESEGEGKGSTFYFSLPVVKDKPYDANEGEGPILR